MKKYFNVNGPCDFSKHYMVDISGRLQEIKVLIDNGDYFVINRARQYGKTTTLKKLKQFLSKQYLVFSISFEGFTEDVFKSETAFCRRLFKLLYTSMIYGNEGYVPDNIKEECRMLFQPDVQDVDFWTLSNFISMLCVQMEMPVVLMIDEVDQASSHEIFLAFLGMLRDQYINRNERPAFQSVILAGVYDIKNLKLKIRTEQEHQYNSPWNIAASFRVDMSFSARDITGMLEEYEKDHKTGMRIKEIASVIYAYTAGYPFLVSALCKIMDEETVYPDNVSPWTKKGVAEAVRILLKHPNTLFDDMVKHLAEYPELSSILQSILFEGAEIPFNAYGKALNIGIMFGFIKDKNGLVSISNRIFETHLYNYFLSEELSKKTDSRLRMPDRNQFVRGGFLDMDLVMEKFAAYYSDLYNEADETFVEKYGRKMFLLYLKPIINGTGNFYIEAETRDSSRTDVIVDYLGKQYIIELKIWRGTVYQQKGEKQLADYLALYHLEKGYLLTFNFNKNKQTRIQEISCSGKTIVEVTV